MSHGKRILIVDDDDAIRALLLTVFQRRGFDADGARNGIDAMEKLEAGRYALLVLDLMMPRMNGYEVLDHLAAMDPHSRPLVLVLTAGTGPRDFDPALVVGTVQKPFDIEMLVDTVAACIEASRSMPDSTEAARPSSPFYSQSEEPN